jgi:hypothetical protein
MKNGALLFETASAQARSRLLIAAIDDVPIDLDRSYIEPVVQFDVEPAAESHRESSFR